MLLNNQWIPEEIKEEIKKYLETKEYESTMIQTYGTQVLGRRVFIVICF